MGNNKINNKIFNPISRKEMYEVLGGKKVREYMGQIKVKIECPEECGCNGPCIITMECYNWYDINDKTGERTLLKEERETDKL